MKTKITALFVATAGFASAATIFQSESAVAFTASGTRDFTFVKFDTMGGTRTLTSVTLSFSFDKTGGSYGVDNDSDVSGDITFTHNLAGRLSSADVSVGTAGTYVNALSEATFAIGADDGDADVTYNAEPGDPDFKLYEPTSILATGHSATIASGSWGAYSTSGAGTFAVRFQASQTFGVDGVGGLQSQTIASQATPTVTVTYNYIPEPSAALLGGLGMLCLLRRRR
jgi:hypothetical protein